MDTFFDHQDSKGKKLQKNRKGKMPSKKHRASDSESAKSRGEKKRRKSKRSASSSSADSSIPSSVFRGVSEDQCGKSWNALMARSRK